MKMNMVAKRSRSMEKEGIILFTVIYLAVGQTFQPMGTITGHVLGKATNQPITDAVVCAIRLDSSNSFMAGPGFNPEYISPFADTTGPDGGYMIGGVPPGSYIVFAKARKYIPQFFQDTDSIAQAQGLFLDTAGAVNAIDFFLRAGGQISGIVVTKDGKPFDSIDVNLNSEQGSFYLHTWSDTSGAFSFSGLPTGKYCLHMVNAVAVTAANTNQCGYSVVEGGSLSGIRLVVERGGVIAGGFTSPTFPDSFTNQGFEIAMFNDSLKGENGRLWESWTTWANVDFNNPNRFVSNAVPVGKWRCIFRPQQALQGPSMNGRQFISSRAYSLGTGTSFFSQQPITTVDNDTTWIPTVNFTKGFSVFGRISFEGGERYVGGQIIAYIKDNNSYVPVSRGYINQDSTFELPGLIDERDYFIWISVPTYPVQFWSPQGSTVQPEGTYHFSTTAFIQPAIRVMKMPRGYFVIPPSLSAWSVDSAPTGSFSLQIKCDAPSGMDIDSIRLYSKDGFGVLKLLAAFPYFSTQTTYTWRETRDLSQAFFCYVFAGKGANGQLRQSNIVWPDQFNGANPSPDSFFIAIVPVRNGLQINWKVDSSFQAASLDTTILYRKKTDEAEYKRFRTLWGTFSSERDGDFSAADVGKTVYYKLEMSKNGTVVKRSKEIKFVVSQEFLAYYSKRLNVGASEQYTTIQAAVNAANNFDIIAIAPGVYYENVNLGGKAVSLEGDWRYGAAPVIDGSGSIAVTVPYTSQSQGFCTIGINGLKIQNSLTGIAAFSGINVNQCLFVNITREALLYEADSAAVAAAGVSDPFAEMQINQNVWQCTFIGGSPSQMTIRAITYNNGTGADSSAPSRGFIGVNNSLFYNYQTSRLPIEVNDWNTSAEVRNCNFWLTSAMPSSSRIKIAPPILKEDPRFMDFINYFVSDSSLLRHVVSAFSWIGYDNRRGQFMNDNDAPEIPPVSGRTVSVAGLRRIDISWDPFPDTVKFAAYIVFRAPGIDSLFIVNSQSQWEPKFEDSFFSIIDTFRTTQTRFSDTSAAINTPYIYIVAGITDDGRIGKVNTPYPPALSSYIVQITPPSAIGKLAARVSGFSKVALQWSRPLSGQFTPQAYDLYRFQGGDALVAAGSDSNAVRQLLLSAEQSPAAADVFTVRDTQYIDAAAVFGLSYLYVVSVADSSIAAAKRPLAWTLVRLDSLLYREIRPVKLTADTWHMIGPWGVGSLSFEHNATAVIYTWDDFKPVDKLYSQYVTAGVMQAGAGYWFKSAADTVIAVTGQMHNEVIVKQDSLWIRLNKGQTGWNQVASPLPFPVRPGWLGNGAYQLHAWNGDSAQYRNVDTLQPWRAYWMFTDRDTQLAVRPSDEAIFGDTRFMGKRSSQAHWEVRISLSGDGNDPDNFIGVVGPARKGASTLHYPKPPPAFDYPQLFIVNRSDSMGKRPLWNEKLTMLYMRSDPVPLNKLEWMVGVSPSSKETKVGVHGVSALPTRVGLFWITSGGAIDARERSEITIAPHKENVYAYLVATANSKDLFLYSNKFDLRRCMPNPFRLSTTFEFTVPYAWNKDGSKKEGEVRELALEIFDIAGRHVATVFSGWAAVGEHRIQWRGGSDAGHTVAAGAYIARLSGSDFQKTLKVFKAR